MLHIGFRLQDFFRAVDCVARLGGDEFAVVLPDCPVDEALKVAQRLVKTLSDPATKEGLPEELAKIVNFSVGVATMPAHTHDRRHEVYLSFDIAEGRRVVHLMREPR